MSAPAALVEEALVNPDEPHWVNRAAFRILTIAQLSADGAIWFALWHHYWWLAVPLMLGLGHIMHGQLIGFHEASHGMLRQRRWLNDLDGQLLGFFSFTSFTLYRAAHQTHHIYLSTERDEEFWPFVDTATPRALRILVAVLELTGGLFFTPCIFLRTFFRAGSPIRARRVRRRIWLELIGMAVGWSAVLGLVAWQGWWKYFLGLYLVPAWIAGNLQSWRRYIEHVGVLGATPHGSTRSIVADTFAGRLVSFTLLHEPFHGVHHETAGIPHTHLPRYASSLQPAAPFERPPFPTYRHALIDLLQNLSNPRVGAHWRSL